MIETVQKFIIENNLLGKKILIGLSGGVDSAVLCDILSKIEEIKTVAIHLNHNWRGDESKRDEEFARNFAKEREIEFYSDTLKAPKKTETSAREARYEFFEKCKVEFGADAVFLAHNKNDNIETLIYRLIKGTGPRGLNSIPKIRDFYYRPLINVERFEIEEYARKNDINFILDSSNFDTKYKRNLIRGKILPLMKEINKDVISSLSTFIEVNKMNQKIIDSILEETKKEVFFEDKILKDKFLKLSSEIQYELINRFMQGVLKNRDFKTIEKLVQFIKNNNSSKISIGADKFLKIYDNKIYIVCEKSAPVLSKEVPLVLGENIFYSGYKIIIEKTITPNKFLKSEDNIQFVALDFKKPYVLRTRKNGDIIQPFGSKSLQKLKTFLIKKKIPSEIREEIPMIALDNEILFIPNVIVSEKLRVDKNDETCYKIVIKKDK